MVLSVQKQGNTRETADPEIQPRGVTTADSAAPSAPRTAQEGGALDSAPRTAQGLPVQHVGQLGAPGSAPRTAQRAPGSAPRTAQGAPGSAPRAAQKFSTADSSGLPYQYPGQLRGTQVPSP